jgi:hypothetical protein
VSSPSPTQAAVLFSGGSDSTLTAALAADEFDHIHLLTFSRFGIFHIENSVINVGKLQARYGDHRFEHHLIDINDLFKRVSYDRYLSTLRRHGFFVLSTCGMCKLAMHLRALLFCLDNGIEVLCDGANQAMDIYPAQMKPVIQRMQGMYAHFDIDYRTPVFDYDGPSEMQFMGSDSDENMPGFWNKEERESEDKETTDRKLYEMGIFDSPRTKGTETDLAMQPRCFQFILFRIFVHWYYLPYKEYSKYESETVAFYDEKITRFTELAEQHLKNPGASPLARYL